jgi:ABC-type Mn2+/Zn2+ transport system ATPase subunit
MAVKMMSDHDIVLEVSNLRMAYDEQAIIEGLSFSVKQRDILIVLGPNGAGKTTLLRGLLNLLPYQGSVTWHARKNQLSSTSGITAEERSSAAATGGILSIQNA